MKMLILSLALLPLFAQSQDCKPRRTTDPYTKEVKVSSSFIKLDGVSMSVHADSKEIDIMFSFSRKEKCFNDASVVSMFFDGTRQKANFRSGGPMNCEGFFHVIFRNAQGTNSLLDRMTKRMISSMEFTDSNKEKVVIELDAEQQEKVRKAIECIVAEGKTLLK